MKRGRVDTKDIPGGRGLAQYVAQVVLSHMHQQESELKILEKKVQRQQKVLQRGPSKIYSRKQEADWSSSMKGEDTSRCLAGHLEECKRKRK
jgi:hypothetical protein